MTPGVRTPLYDFRDAVALVTGASAGIGLAAARAFAEAGAAVVLVDIDGEALRSATAALTAAGHNVRGLTCNLANEAQVADVVSHTVLAFGRLDIAFNNAGVAGPSGAITDESAEAFASLPATLDTSRFCLGIAARS